MAARVEAQQSELFAQARQRGRPQVHVSAEPTFASLFLIPRLSAFASIYPDIDLHFDAVANRMTHKDGTPY